VSQRAIGFYTLFREKSAGGKDGDPDASERSLEKDWLKPEGDEAWEYL